MRSLPLFVAAMMVAAVAASGCAAPSVGSYGNLGSRDLPDRESSDDDDDSTSTEDDADTASKSDTGSTSSAATTTKQTLTVTSTGDGTGGVTSEPAGVTCTGATC